MQALRDSMVVHDSIVMKLIVRESVGKMTWYEPI